MITAPPHSLQTKQNKFTKDAKEHSCWWWHIMLLWSMLHFSSNFEHGCLEIVLLWFCCISSALSSFFPCSTAVSLSWQWKQSNDGSWVLKISYWSVLEKRSISMKWFLTNTCQWAYDYVLADGSLKGWSYVKRATSADRTALGSQFALDVVKQN